MDKKPVIIFYSEGLNAYLLYSELVKNYPRLIQCLVELPGIPRIKNKNLFKQPMFYRILKRSSLNFVLLNFCTVVLYRFISSIFRHRLRDIARANGVPVFKYKYMDEEFIEKIKELKPGWIINGSPNILKKDIIQLPKFGILNYHCAPLPEYRGAGNYFWILYNKEKTTRATLHYVDEGLDTGDIILTTPDITIKPRISVFELWYQGRLTAYPSFKKMIPYFNRSEKIPAINQGGAQANLRSFPGKEVAQKVKEYGHRVLKIRDLITIINIAATGKIKRYEF